MTFIIEATKDEHHINNIRNSAIDAVILARYVWLAASRYPEQGQTICLCVSEHLNSAYMIPPAGKSLAWNEGRAVTPEDIYGWIATQMTT